jgi:porin
MAGAQGEPSTQPASAPAVATQPASAPAPQEFLDYTHNDRLTGDWGGARTALESLGLGFSLRLVSLYQQNAHGGANTHHAHQVTGSADLELTFDTEPLGLWKGGQLYVFAEGGWGDGIDEDVGDLFGVNGDASGDLPIRVRELWYQQQFFDDKLRVKVGKMDLAVEIDTNAYANYEVTQFLNCGLINTGNLPFPDYGLGAVVGVKPNDLLYVTWASGDAQADGDETGFRTACHGSDDFFHALELGLTPTWETSHGKLPGNYRFIGWYDPQPKQRFLRPRRDGEEPPARFKRDDAGFAFNMDQMLYRENPSSEEDTQGLGLFARYGYAPDNVNAVEHFWSLGAQYQGLVPTRDNDVLGFGFAQGILSDRLVASQGFGDRQSVYELYYSCLVLPWLTISPDFQYITDPGGDKRGRDALVAGVRVVMSF